MMYPKIKTKKIAEKKLKDVRDWEGKPLKKVKDDEEFYKVPGWSNVYSSQYAQIIKVKRSGKLLLLKPYYDPKRGYHTVMIRKRRGKKSKPKCVGLHVLVALVWCEKPDFTLPMNPHCKTENQLHCHHTIAVKESKRERKSLNYASHLMWTYGRYHRAIEGIKTIAVKTRNGKWLYKKSLYDVAEHYKVKQFDIFEMMLCKPQKAAEVELYSKELIDIEGEPITVYIRVKRKK